MQLRRGSRDRATWTLLDLPLQAYPRWTTLFPFGLPLFPCQLERYVFRNPQTRTADLYCIALDSTTTPPHCIICDEFLSNALQRLVFAPCPLTTLSIRIPMSGLHETRHRYSCATLGSSALSAHPGMYFGLCKLYTDTPPCRTLDVVTCITHTASARATPTWPVVPLGVPVARSLANLSYLIDLHLTLLFLHPKVVFLRACHYD
jgi:hypothetical protein